MNTENNNHQIEGEEQFTLKEISSPTIYNIGKIWEHIEKLQKRVKELEELQNA